MAYLAPSHYLNQFWVIANWTLGNKFQWNFNKNSLCHAFENTVCKMAAILLWPPCVKHFFDGQWLWQALGGGCPVPVKLTGPSQLLSTPGTQDWFLGLAFTKSPNRKWLGKTYKRLKTFLTCQVPFLCCFFRLNMTKFPNFYKSGWLNCICLMMTPHTGHIGHPSQKRDLKSQQPLTGTLIL